MTPTRRGRAVRITSLLALAALGCGGPKAGEVAAPPTTSELLTDLKMMLASCEENHRPPPARLADAQKIEPAFPGAYRILRSGECVYVWGAGLSAGSSAVLAYEKDVPTNGGPVLLQDGSLKTLSAAEFAAAPKATK